MLDIREAVHEQSQRAKKFIKASTPSTLIVEADAKIEERKAIQDQSEQLSSYKN